MIKTPNTGATVNVRGSVVVMVVLVAMGMAALATVLFKPAPMSSIEVVGQKQLLVYHNADVTSAEQLKQMTQERLDSYIETLNYILRLRDSIYVIGHTDLAVGDTEYSIDEANQKLVITGLIQREAAAMAKALQSVGRNPSPAVDSLYELVHQPMPKFPNDSTLIRERNTTFERYVAQIFN